MIVLPDVEFMLTPEEAEGSSDTSTLMIPMRSQMFKPETGYDTVILEVPAGLVPEPPEYPGANPKTSLLLLKTAIDMAELMNEGLRMANYWITRDPEVVRQRGLMHDCADCRAGVDRALAAMAANPKVVIAVGQLSWCDK